MFCDGPPFPAALEESIDNEDDIQTKVQNILEVGQQLSKEGKAKGENRPHVFVSRGCGFLV